MVIRVEKARADVCSLLCSVSLNEGLKRCRVTILLQVERWGHRVVRSAVWRRPVHLRRGPLMSQLPPSCSPDPEGLLHIREHALGLRCCLQRRPGQRPGVHRGCCESPGASDPEHCPQRPSGRRCQVLKALTSAFLGNSPSPASSPLFQRQETEVTKQALSGARLPRLCPSSVTSSCVAADKLMD